MNEQNKKYVYLALSELILAMSACLFWLFDLSSVHEIAQHPVVELQQEMPMIQAILAFVLLGVFFIYMMLGVKSLLQFSVAGVMVLVQMWISFLFIGSGSDSVMTSTSLLSLSLFGILTVLHFFLAKLSLKALHQHEFVG